MGTRGNSGGLRWRSRYTQSRWLIPVLLFVVAVVVRTPALARYVTPDELNWVYRTIRFREALAAGDWTNTIQSGHPGIVTMWLAAAAMQLQLLFHPADQSHIQWASALYWLDPQNDDAFRHLAVFLTAARWAVILTTSLGLVAVYQLIHRVVSPQAGILATLFLIFDPFTAGLSGLLHVDSLLATFCLLTVLLVWRAMFGPQTAQPSEGLFPRSTSLMKPSEGYIPNLDEPEPKKKEHREAQRKHGDTQSFKEFSMNLCVTSFLLTVQEVNS